MLWVKTFHILFVMAWVAGLFYMPRIFVHYVEGQRANEDVRRLVVMAGKLFGFSSVMMILALGLGTWLWLGWWYGSGGWIVWKIGLVLLLLAYHFQCYRFILMMREGALPGSALFFRIFNESALFLLIPILILAVVKPF